MELEAGTLYDINKNAILNDPILKKHEVKDKLRQVMKPFVEKSNNKYFMLLCREKYNFTLFNCKEKTEEDINQSLKWMYECLINRGAVLSIDLTENKDALEIWIKIVNDETEDACVYYFFPYDLGVIETS